MGRDAIEAEFFRTGIATGSRRRVNAAAPITADAALLEAYAEWRRLADLEGDAIRARDWLVVAECQHQLQQLQPHIIRLTDQARAEWKRTGADQPAKEKNLRSIISRLIELELHNSSLLTVAQEAAREEFGQLELARQNLKRIQRFYAPQKPAVWSSFS